MIHLYLMLLVGCDREKPGKAHDSAATAGTDDDALVCPEEEAPGPRLLRRLTHQEYANTLSDLLGYTVEPSELPSADVLGWFDNESSALDLSSLLADEYRSIAEEAAEAADLSSLLPCDPDEIGKAACATLFIDDFGTRAFRRPLSEDDISRYRTLWELVARESGFDEGIRWVIAGMLQSPHFLYRMELGVSDGESFRLTDWELATELSYLVVGTTPDAELLALAEDGTLSDPGVLDAQLERLLADPRADQRLTEFVDGWLQLDRLANVSRDATTYPELTDEVRAAMSGETARLVVDVAGSGGTLADLLLARHTYMTDELAAYYGLSAGTGEADADGYRRVELDGVTYGGLLTQGSVLTTHALPSSSSPIHRGVMVRERILCQELPPPPSNLDTSPPAVDPSLSTRDRYAAHSTNPECAVCHEMIDPIGFAFERYDGVGRWREDDDGHAIDSTGYIASSHASDGEFDGVFELATLLSTSPDAATCYAEMALTWATGLYDDDAITCAAERLASESDPGGLSLRAPLIALLSSEHFFRRLGEAGEGDSPAAGVRPALDDLPEDTGDWGTAAGPDNADLSLSVFSDWGTGYCATGTVSNSGDAAVDWQVTVTVDGVMDSYWNAVVEETDGIWVFTGADWNATIEVGETAEFGFCVTR